MRYETVKIGCKKGEVTCDKPKVQLYWETGPDSIEWVVQHAPKGALAEIVWEGKSPFRKADAKTNKGRLTASENRKVKGEFKYTIRFTDEEGKLIGELDPVVLNDPRQPLPHDGG
jgi:hypothetical protein